MTEFIKIKKRDKERLSKLKDNPAVRRMLVQRGINDDVDDEVYYSDLFELMVRDDYEKKSHELQPTRCQSKDYYQDLAGENTPVHRVVTDHIDMFESDVESWENYFSNKNE